MATTRLLWQTAVLSYFLCFDRGWAFQAASTLRLDHQTLSRRGSIHKSRRTTPSRTPLLVLASSNSNYDRPRRSNPFIRVLSNFRNTVVRIATRFQSLPAKAKRAVVMQWVVVCLFFGAAGKTYYQKAHAPPSPIEVSYSSFLDLLEDDSAKLDVVRIGADKISYKIIYQSKPNAKQQTKETTTLEDNESQNCLSAFTRKVPASSELVGQLRSKQVAFAAAAAPRPSNVSLAVRSSVLLFYFLILFRLYRGLSSSQGKSDIPGKLARTSDLPPSSFDDIQGIDDAKVEVMELVDSLRNPDKYAILGARAPTGCLLVGPPGTGKTMLARATAATAGVPLIYCSGSDFVEMFVGRGAARVRKLFERAGKLSPCIIFIDELDALGKSRDSGTNILARSNDEAEQTLNQLLACMDGLDSSRQICVLAATNRKDVLDQALIRPGRFDRIVQLELPNSEGREKIIRVHTSKLPGFQEGSGVDPDRLNSLGKGRMVDLSAIAAVTEGFSGAELEFLVNEAAIRAVRRVSVSQEYHNKNITPHVEARDFEESLASFFVTRKPKKNDIFRNILKNN